VCHDVSFLFTLIKKIKKNIFFYFLLSVRYFLKKYVVKNISFLGNF